MVLIIKKIILIVFRLIFMVMPIELVRRIIIIIPRLCVSAPPGIKFFLNDYLKNFSIKVDTVSSVERKMFTRNYEKDTIKIIENFVNEGDVCFDIGANVGPITLALAQKAKPKGKVYAFEPGPPIFERLVGNISLNPLYASAIIAENLGVSEQNGQLFWAEGSEDFDQRGNGSLRVGPDYHKIKVDVVSLDFYCQSKGIENIDFIKIDVEAMEYEVLKGAKNILGKSQPIIYYETLPNMEATLGFPVFTEIKNFLKNLNYKFYSVDIYGNIKQVNKVGCSLNSLAVPTNFDI